MLNENNLIATATASAILVVRLSKLMVGRPALLHTNVYCIHFLKMCSGAAFKQCQHRHTMIRRADAVIQNLSEIIQNDGHTVICNACINSFYLARILSHVRSQKLNFVTLVGNWGRRARLRGRILQWKYS